MLFSRSVEFLLVSVFLQTSIFLFQFFCCYCFQIFILNVLPEYMYVHMCVPGALRSQKRVLGPLELELWLSASIGVLGTKPGSSAKVISVLNCQTISLALYWFWYRSSPRSPG